MRKHNFAGHVNINYAAQHVRWSTRARLRVEAWLSSDCRLCSGKLLDPRGAGMYLYLHNRAKESPVPRPKSPDPKTDALRSVGALNPTRGRQRREIFGRQRLLRPPRPRAGSLRMVRRVRTDGRPIAETATRFGVSRPPTNKLSAEFEREGICGLLPK